MKYKYKVYDKIINSDEHKGVITALGTSIIDSVEIPSYWIQYDESVHPDGYARNTWESSIICKIRKYGKI